MDSIQTQIVALNTKVDALHQVIEQLNVRILAVVAPSSPLYNPVSDHEMYGGSDAHMLSVTRPSQHYRGLGATLEHKDILADDEYIEDAPGRDPSIDPAIQIQRLTTQLTAAYNRIAALEEQLLSRRVEGRVH